MSVCPRGGPTNSADLRHALALLIFTWSRFTPVRVVCGAEKVGVEFVFSILVNEMSNFVIL